MSDNKSIKDLGNGWVEYWFYYGNASWPSDERYRYNEQEGKLEKQIEYPLMGKTAVGEFGRLITEIDEQIREIDLASAKDITVIASPPSTTTSHPASSWLTWWVDVLKDDSQEWEWFVAHKIQEEEFARRRSAD